MCGMKNNKFSSKGEVFFEEAVFDSYSLHKNLNHVELPVSKKVFILITIAAILTGVLVFLRVVYLASFRGAFYTLRSEANVGKEIYRPGNRGVIYDRYGTVLTDNISASAVSIKTKDFLGNSEEEKQNITDILEISRSEIDDKISRQNIERSPSFILARDVDPEKIIKLKALNFKGVEVIDDYKRRYINGPIFSHILGYTGMDNTNDEIVGKTGIEFTYNDILKGIDGMTVAYRDVKGNVFDKKIVEEPKNGNSITLTIDADLQTYFYGRLNQALIDLGRNSAVGIAIDPRNGEVLSLISLPSFDNNIFSASGNNSEKNKVLNSIYKPLFNKAVSGAYTPASTIKPMVALAALAEGIIDPTKVTRTALENAVSIAGMFLTTEAVVTDKPKKEEAPKSEEKKEEEKK